MPTITIELDDEIYEKLKFLALRNGRTIEEEVLHILKKYLKAQEEQDG